MSDLNAQADCPALPIAGAIDRFLGDLEIGKSAATVRTYRTGLGRFVEYLSEKETSVHSVSDLTTDQPLGFTRWLARATRQVPRTTIETYTTAVSRFYAYLVREEIRADLALVQMQLRLTALRGKRRRRLPRVPSDDSIERILETAHASPHSRDVVGECIRLRNVALIETLRGSGLRVSEAVSLRRGDLDRQGRSAIVTGKGEKQRLIIFTEDAWRAIDAYLTARQDGASGRGLASLPVFARHDRATGRRTMPLSTNGVREIVFDLVKRAGLEELTITPHRFRAWFATHLVAETGDLAAVQDLLGHESADTTRIYTRVAARRLRSIHAQAFGGGSSINGESSGVPT